MDDQKELFVVVNKNDKIMSFKTRRECHSNKNLIHRVVHITLFNNKNEILLQKRSLKKDLNPGLYTLSATGHVTKGESYLDSAKRELLEELGVSAELSFITKFIINTKNESEMVCLFTAKSEGPFRINKDEIDSVGFFSKEEIAKIKHKLTPHAVKSLQKLNIL